MKLKVLIDNKKYDSWKYLDLNTLQLIELKDNFNPLQFKLFSDDTFEYYQENKSINLIHSSIRYNKALAGILILNKTYGRTENDKLLYKCVPDDKRIPDFLIPIGNKKKSDNFIKSKNNLYIIFEFKSWIDKHPIGQLIQTIGDVSEIGNFFEYQLYCKNLNISLQKFNRVVSNTLKQSKDKFYINTIIEKYPNIENRLEEEIITIDPLNSQDYDDAISIKIINDDTTKISIYVSNVALIMDHFNLWNSFSERIATIYLPDRKRPMLPTILSENLCSLKEAESRIVFCIDIYFIKEKIDKIEYKNAVIKVSKNYIYEQEELLNNNLYINLLNYTKKLSKHYKYIGHIRNSHDIIAYYMIFMNHEVSKFMLKSNNGIYRSVINDSNIEYPSNLPEEIETVFKIFHSSSGQYSSYENKTGHEYILNGLDSYLHITSPIRRLVDLLNLIKFQENLNNTIISKNADIFYNYWFDRLDYINTTMRVIKKVQNDCELLYLCTNNIKNLEQEHEGYIFDKLLRNDGLYHYNIYLPNLKMLNRLIIKDNLENYKCYKFKLYIFINEDNLKKKIRLQLIK